MKAEKLHVDQPWSDCSLPQDLLPGGEVHVWRLGLNVSDLVLRRFRESLCEKELVAMPIAFDFPISAVALSRRVALCGPFLRSYLSMEPRE